MADDYGMDDNDALYDAWTSNSTGFTRAELEDLFAPAPTANNQIAIDAARSQRIEEEARLNDIEIKSKGLPGGLAAFQELSPDQQEYISQKPEGSGAKFNYGAKTVLEEFEEAKQGLLNQAFDGGIRDEKSANAILAESIRNGSLSNPSLNALGNAASPFKDFLSTYDESINKQINEGINPGGSTFVENPGSILDLVRGEAKGNIKDVLGANWPMMAAPFPMGLLGPGLSFLTGSKVIGTYEDPITGKGMHLVENRDGTRTSSYISPEDNPSYGNRDEGGYNNNTIQQAPVVQNLNPQIAAGAFNREQALEDLIQRTQTNTTNPGIDDFYFNQLIRSGIGDRNTALGDNITQGQFDNSFNTDFLGQGILDDETRNLQGQATEQLNTAFTGNAFDPLDDDIINSIVQQRAAPARQQIATAVSRGNYNPTGGRTANEAIDFQTPKATSRIREVGEGVLGGYQKDVDAIKDTALSSIGNFKLGDDLFNATPFTEQRSSLIEERTPNLSGDINQSIGGEPLFNSGDALSKGSRIQGVVSGKPANESFLDTIAAREAASARAGSSTRGLGSRGSGVF